MYYNVHEATITLSDGTVIEAGGECRDHGAGRVAWDGSMLTSNVYDSDCNEFAFDVMQPTVDMTEFMSNGGDVDFLDGNYYGSWSGGTSASASLNLEFQLDNFVPVSSPILADCLNIFQRTLCIFQALRIILYSTLQ